MSTSYSTRTIPTTTYNLRGNIPTTTYSTAIRTGVINYLTWDESDTAWDSLIFTWDNWAEGVPATSFTPRTPI